MRISDRLSGGEEEGGEGGEAALGTGVEDLRSRGEDWRAQLSTEAVATRTAEFNQLNRALAKADQRQDQFLAMLAHELRNPLGPIRNAIQILKQLGPPEPHLALGQGDHRSSGNAPGSTSG